MKPPAIAYVGLGSNLDHPEKQVTTAITELDQQPKCQLIKASSLFYSKPMGPQDQPDFINAVVKLSTRLTPEALLTLLLDLEQQHGRVRKRHWGERTLDCDLLTYDQQIIQTDRLTLPHPGIMQRPFVYEPLLEICPDFVLPKNHNPQ